MSRTTIAAAADTLRWATHIVIPTDWTPGQALAVFELLDRLRDAVASLYLDQIQTVLQGEQGPRHRHRLRRPRCRRRRTPILNALAPQDFQPSDAAGDPPRKRYTLPPRRDTIDAIQRRT